MDNLATMRFSHDPWEDATGLGTRAGHTRSEGRLGFTLIELLIVVVLIGLLATIAIPKFASSKQKAFDATAKSDVRRAWVAAEGYFADNMTYPPNMSDANFEPSPGVTFTEWKVETTNGILSVHLHVEHGQSSHYYHSRYPVELEIEQRNKK